MAFVSFEFFFSQNSLPTPNSLSSPKTIPPVFEHFPIVRFGWNFLHRFILAWYLWRLHFYFEIPLPSLWIPPTLSSYLWTLSYRQIWIKLLKKIYFGMEVCTFFSQNSTPPSNSHPSFTPNLSPRFWTLSHCPILIKFTTWQQSILVWVRTAS